MVSTSASALLRTSFRLASPRLAAAIPRRSFAASPRWLATESNLLGPLGITGLSETRAQTSARFAKGLFGAIEADEATKAALGRVIHLSQKAGVSPKMWLESPDPEHPLRQVLENKAGRLASLIENDPGFREAVSQLKAEFRRLGVMDQLDILFVLVDAAARPPQLGDNPTPPSDPSSS